MILLINHEYKFIPFTSSYTQKLTWIISERYIKNNDNELSQYHLVQYIKRKTAVEKRILILFKRTQYGRISLCITSNRACQAPHWSIIYNEFKICHQHCQIYCTATFLSPSLYLLYGYVLHTLLDSINCILKIALFLSLILFSDFSNN